MLETILTIAIIFAGIMTVAAIWLKGKLEDINEELYKAQTRIYSLEYRVKDIEKQAEARTQSEPSEANPAQAQAPEPQEKTNAASMQIAPEKSQTWHLNTALKGGAEYAAKSVHTEIGTKPPQKDGPDFLDSIKGYFAENIASKAFVWLGGLTLIFAGFFLAKYTIELGLVTPLRRVIFTAVFAVALAVAAEVFHRKGKSELIAGVLYAAAIAVAYGDFYAASGYYGLMPIKPGIAGMILCGAAATALSFRYGQYMLLMAIAGVFLAPAILSTDSPDTILLVCYLAVMTVCGVAVSVKAQKALPFALTLISNASWMAVWFAEIRQFEHISWVFGYMVTASCLFYFATPKMKFSDKPIFEGEDFLPRGLLTRELPMLAAAIACFGASLDTAWTAKTQPMLEVSFFPIFCAMVFAFASRNKMMRLASFPALVGLAIFIPNVIPGGNANYAITALFGAAIIYFAAMSVFSGSRKAFAPLLSFALITNVILGVVVSGFSISGFRDYQSAACLAAMAVALAAALASKKDDESKTAQRFIIWGLGIAATFYVPFVKTDSQAVAYLGTAIAVFFAIGLIKKDTVWNEGSFLGMIILSLLSILSFPFYDYLDNNSPAFPRFDEMAGFFAVNLIALTAVIYVYLKGKSGITTAILLGVIAACAGLNAVALASRQWNIGMHAYAHISRDTAVLAVSAFAMAACGLKFKIKPIRAAGAVLLWLCAARIALADFLAASPAFKAIYIPGFPAANALFASMLLPAMLFCAWGFMEHDARLKKIIFAAAIALLFIFANFELRFCFQGNLMNNAAGVAEIYAYSPLWLAFGITLLAAGFWRKSGALRTASLIFIIVAVCKVFLYDASALDGLLRVLSFALLGVCLIGIGFFYAKFVFKDEEKI